ncbi:hypothetical protein E2C01_089960 [Portunus trituberculatus]|uniref:Uncharacterized protein n=1 Tax=Portunus trituberculatus TaxID=210409 RepID=A0A5B7JKN4_PORTR|nr:hypothetical protein [Portunus trituberculatus]
MKQAMRNVVWKGQPGSRKWGGDGLGSTGGENRTFPVKKPTSRGPPAVTQPTPSPPPPPSP